MSGANEQSGHYGPELQDFLDGTLAEPAASHVAAHLARCQRCQRELDALRWVKTELRQRITDEPLPPELAARVRSALDTEDERMRRAMTTRRAWIVAGLVAAAGAVFTVFQMTRRRGLPAFVAADFEAYRSGSTRLGIESSDPKTVEAYFASHGVSFATHVFDLSMMEYQLIGGRVHELDGRTSAMFAYRGANSAFLVCQMFRGRVSELPPTDDVRQHRGIGFHVYRAESLTLVFWPEGDIVCVLTSDAPIDSVVQLAFAKAVRAS